MPSLVKKMNSVQFNEKFVFNRNSSKDCLIEINKDHCGACAYAGKVFDALSLKFDNHGYDVTMARLKIDNSL